jgi:uncharacterized protein (UPF0332 family)
MTDRETLIQYRIKQSEETLADAEAMSAGGMSTRSIVNRAYYAMFYALLGLFLSTDTVLKTSKHSGIISMFDRVFILTGKMDKRHSKSLHRMFNTRQVADYKEMVEISKEEAAEAIQQAKDFVDEVKRFISA